MAMRLLCAAVLLALCPRSSATTGKCMDVSIPGPSRGLCKGAPAFEYSACVPDVLSRDEFVEERVNFLNRVEGARLITSSTCNEAGIGAKQVCDDVDAVVRTDRCDINAGYCAAVTSSMQTTTRCSTTQTTTCIPGDTLTLCKFGTVGCPKGSLLPAAKLMCCDQTKLFLNETCISGSNTDWAAVMAKSKAAAECSDTDCYEHVPSAARKGQIASGAARGSTAGAWAATMLALATNSVCR